MRIEIICPVCSSEFTTDKVPCTCPECSRSCGDEMVSRDPAPDASRPMVPNGTCRNFTVTR